MGEVREPSPDDDVIVVDRDGIEWVRHYSDGPPAWQAVDWSPTPGRVMSWADLCAKRDPRVYVPASRLAAAEAKRDEALATVARVKAALSWLDDHRYAMTVEDAARVETVASRVRAALDGTVPADLGESDA